MTRETNIEENCGMRARMQLVQHPEGGIDVNGTSYMPEWAVLPTKPNGFSDREGMEEMIFDGSGELHKWARTHGRTLPRVSVGRLSDGTIEVVPHFCEGNHIQVH
jgi:hypothetical protein